MPEFVSRNVFSQTFAPNPSEKVYRCQASGFWEPKNPHPHHNHSLSGPLLKQKTWKEMEIRKHKLVLEIDQQNPEKKEKPFSNRIKIPQRNLGNPGSLWGRKTLQKENQSELGKH